MSKAILIIDMPKRCLDCPLCYKEEMFTYRCIVSDDQVGDANKIYDDCPLKPMPKKKEKYEDYVERIGYNKCIDELLGGNQ